MMLKSIEKAVSTAFSKAGITDEVLYSGPIVHTDLPWQNPPLKPEGLMLRGVPLAEYFIADIRVNEGALERFYFNTLKTMYSAPQRVMYRKDFRGISSVMPNTLSGQRDFRFSVPEGIDSSVDLLGAATFALEAVHLANQSLGKLIDCYDESNYFVTLASGTKIGIADGRIAGIPEWKGDLTGVIEELLTMPRGAASHECYYDIVAKVRSVLYENRRLFEEEFQALDYALQALRVLNRDNLLGTLLKTGRPVKDSRKPGLSEKLAAVKFAIETMAIKNISDRSKVHMIRAKLVPLVMGAWVFNREIYDTSNKVPFILADKVVDRINTRLSVLEQTLAAKVGE